MFKQIIKVIEEHWISITLLIGLPFFAVTFVKAISVGLINYK